MFAIRGSRLISQAVHLYQKRSVTSASSSDKFKVLIVGGGKAYGASCLSIYIFLPLGTGGLAVAHQIYKRFKRSGKPLRDGDIGIVDGSEHHYYQVRRFQSTTEAEVLMLQHSKPGW
jgi:hypothetical protein